MINITIEWRAKTGKFASGSAAYVGSINVGSTHWTTSKQAGGPWQANVILPGVSIKEAFKYQTTEKDARTIVEVAIRRWFGCVEPAIEIPRMPHRSED